MTMRICTTCGGVDDHPRHIHVTNPGDARMTSETAKLALANTKPEDLGDVLEQVRDETVVMNHLDCCAAAGCPDGSCGEIASTFPGNKRLKGKALRTHLVSGQVDHIGPQLNEARLSYDFDKEITR